MNAWRHGREIYVEKLEEKKREKEEREAAALQAAASLDIGKVEQKAEVKQENVDFKIGKSDLLICFCVRLKKPKVKQTLTFALACAV